jgi:hypothetical protein
VDGGTLNNNYTVTGFSLVFLERLLIPEQGVLIPEQGVLIPEQGVLIPEQGVLIPERWASKQI